MGGERGLGGPWTFSPTQKSFSLFDPATGTFKAKTLPCQSPDLEAAPAPIQAPVALAAEDAERKEASSCSYQQINCLDSILRSGHLGTFSAWGRAQTCPHVLWCLLRYLESCNLPSTAKRKCASSSSCTASSASDDDKQRAGPVSVGAKKGEDSGLPCSRSPVLWPCASTCLWGPHLTLSCPPASLPCAIHLLCTGVSFPSHPGGRVVTGTISLHRSISSAAWGGGHPSEGAGGGRRSPEPTRPGQ